MISAAVLMYQTRGVERNRPHEFEKIGKAYLAGHAIDCWCRPWRQLR